MRLRAKGTKPNNSNVSLTASGTDEANNSVSLNAVGASANFSSVTLSADGQVPDSNVVDLGGAEQGTGSWNPIPAIGRKAKKLFANFIPPVYNSSNAGSYTPPPKAPVFAVIPKGVCKECK